MLAKLRRGLTYSNVTASLALFLALGGGAAWAASQIGAGDIKDDAVRSRHIASDNVKSSDIDSDAVRSSDVKDEELTGDDVEDDSLTGSDVDEGTFVDTETFPQGLVVGRIEDLGGAGTVFGSPSGNSTAGSEQSVRTVSPSDSSNYGRLNVRLTSGVPLQAGESRTFALERASAAVLSCTIGQGQDRCSDTATYFGFAPDTLLAFKVDSAGAGLNTNDDAMFGFRASSP